MFTVPLSIISIWSREFFVKTGIEIKQFYYMFIMKPDLFFPSQFQLLRFAIWANLQFRCRKKSHLPTIGVSILWKKKPPHHRVTNQTNFDMRLCQATHDKEWLSLTPFPPPILSTVFFSVQSSGKCFKIPQMY